MTQAWYRVLSLSFGYLGAAAAVLIVLLGFQKYLSDRRLHRRVKKGLPRIGAAATLKVLTGGLRRVPVGQEIRVPYEGTLGSAHSCDVCIPYRRVHLRSAFFWMERDGLHMVALHRDGFIVDDVPVEPGDEAILSDGAVLQIRDLKMVLRLSRGRRTLLDPVTGPYVTTARRSRAQKGYDDGLGAPGKGEARREKKLEKQQNKRGSKQAEPQSRQPRSAKAAKDGAAPEKREAKAVAKKTQKR